MGLPRARRSKYGISLAQISAMTGESLSSLKRQSAGDSEAFRQKIEAVIRGDFQLESPELDSIYALEDTLCSVHFALVKIAWNDAELRARLKPVFDLTAPFVEAV